MTNKKVLVITATLGAGRKIRVLLRCYPDVKFIILDREGRSQTMQVEEVRVLLRGQLLGAGLGRPWAGHDDTAFNSQQ